MTAPENNSNRRRWVLLGGAVVVVIAVAGGLFWFFGRDVPEEASLEGALGAIAHTSQADTTLALEDTTTMDADGGDTTAAPTTTTTTPADTASGVDGAWQVDTSIGSFTFEDATATFVGFRIKEVLGTIGETEAVGRTPEVSGTMEIAGSTITAVDVEANMDALVTNDSRRDSRARGALDTSQFPTATFTLTAPIDLGQVPADGEPITTTASGELTISGVTNPAEFEIEAQREGDLIIVVGSTTVTFSDYGVEVPSAPIVLEVEDSGIIELQLWFSQ